MRFRAALLSLTATLLWGGAAFAADAPVEERCGVMVEENGASRVEAVDGFAVLDAVPPLQRPHGYESVIGVLCARSVFVIDDFDHRVLTDMNVPFYLDFGDVLIVLEISGGQLRVRNLRGELSEPQLRAIQTALNRNQSILQGDPP